MSAERAALERWVQRLAPCPASLAETLRHLSTETPWWRLAAAELLRQANRATPARALCREFILTMGPPSEALRGLRDTVSLLALRLNEHDALQHYLRVCYGMEVAVRLGHGPRFATRGTVHWTLREGRSTFTFSDQLPTHAYFHTIVKNWALELPLLFDYARHHPHAAATVRLGLEDIGHSTGLAYCDNRRDYFLIPDPMFVGTDGYRDMRRQIDETAPAWADRAPLGFWRGTTTGWLNVAGKPHGTWRELPRVVLCELAQNGPDAAHFDVGLSKIVQLPPEAAAEAEASPLLRDHVKLPRLAGYKFQIDIDGNSNAWMGLFVKLYSGSPVLKVQSPAGFRQWYYDRLVPWWNYVPVRRDMADLAHKLLWLAANDGVAEAIGRRGRELAAAMTPEAEIARAHPTITAALHHAAFISRAAAG